MSLPSYRSRDLWVELTALALHLGGFFAFVLSFYFLAVILIADWLGEPPFPPIEQVAAILSSLIPGVCLILTGAALRRLLRD